MAGGQKVEVGVAAEAVTAVTAGATTQLLDAGDRLRFVAAKSVLEDAQHFLSTVKLAGSEQPISAADIAERRLEVLLELLKGAKSADEVRTRANELVKAGDSANIQNLQVIKDEQRPLEAAYRNLAMFYQGAGKTHPEGLVRVFVAHPEDTTDDLLESLKGQIEDGDSFDLDSLTSVLVFTDWVGAPESLQKLGELGKECKALVLVEFDGGDGYEEAVAKWADDFTGMKGDEPWKAHVAMVGNKPVLAKDVRGSSALLLAAEIFKKNADHGTKLVNVELNYTTASGGGLTFEWDLTNKKAVAVFDRALIAVTKQGAEGKYKFWGVNTLSEEAAWGNQIQKVWIKNYLDKVLLKFLNLEAFEIHDEVKLDALRDALQRFLKQNTGPGKILSYGKVLSIEVTDPDEGILDIKIRVTPATATTQLNLEYVATQSDDQFKLADG